MEYQMDKQELANYSQLAFINGIIDATSVIMLHKVFSVLMTGNIIYFITSAVTKIEFIDYVRISLLLNFVLSGILVNNVLIKKSIHFRINLSILFVIAYCIIGYILMVNNYIGKDDWGFFMVANCATTMSVIINNIFYRLSATKYNLVAYTMNLLNLAHTIAEKRYNDLRLIMVPFISFILGLIVASLLTQHIHFFTVLLVIPILINLYLKNTY